MGRFPTLQLYPEISQENSPVEILFKGSENRDTIPDSPVSHFGTFPALPV